MPPIHPTLLIHGYSAEGKSSKYEDMKKIYGDLPEALRKMFGKENIKELDFSRYLSLHDGITIDDISNALDYALRHEYPHLLQKQFNVIIHSTGALVIRNWIRKFSTKPSPIKNLIHLAGANFGSGWAHIGQGQIAKWGRAIFEGADRGLRVLDALELGSSWTLDMHLHFLQENNDMLKDYKIYEYAIIGTQASQKWFFLPIRYGKEDGSDGVVRVSGGNLNFNYVRFGPKESATKTKRKEIEKFISALSNPDLTKTQYKKFESYYEIKQISQPGDKNREEIPFAIPYDCAHTGKDTGIVTGNKPREQVLSLLEQALSVKTENQWKRARDFFSEETDKTYETAIGKGNKAKKISQGSKIRFQGTVSDPQKQFDKHSQLIFRIFDQDGNPVEHFDVFIDGTDLMDDKERFGRLLENKHKNQKTGNIITFYLRRSEFDSDKGEWVSKLDRYKDTRIEIWGEEPKTPEHIVYLPFHFEVDKQTLGSWIADHQTTIIDVELLRIPKDEVFNIRTLK
jgi:hypothetical protein